SKEAIIVLDLFGGSGSTIIACEQTGRHCRMMELDPQYVQVIIERWERMTNETAIDIESGKKWDELNA
ncbi:MAG: site-specific DNA-methyltransferase, partial [Lentisphaeria bacterium]|nr:site-specific DNA-methyltransferase [Lentisphaeria bacterium]